MDSIALTIRSGARDSRCHPYQLDTSPSVRRLPRARPRAPRLPPVPVSGVTDSMRRPRCIRPPATRSGDSAPREPREATPAPSPSQKSHVGAVYMPSCGSLPLHRSRASALNVNASTIRMAGERKRRRSRPKHHIIGSASMSPFLERQERKRLRRLRVLTVQRAHRRSHELVVGRRRRLSANDLGLQVRLEAQPRGEPLVDLANRHAADRSQVRDVLGRWRWVAREGEGEEQLLVLV
mmetsp:Transcript_6954/g.23770  ORF Transcript_6954/g.23770 Transcript_6954/m.23770 type:complete len:237 (-) Transcript_6954:570-1280(-)